MGDRVLSYSSFVIPNGPRNPHTFCRAVIHGDPSMDSARQLWIDGIGRFPCGHGVLFKIRIYYQSLMRELDGVAGPDEWPAHWKIDLSGISKERRDELLGRFNAEKIKELYDKIDGRILCDDDEKDAKELLQRGQTCTGELIPSDRQVLRSIRELVLTSREQLEWRVFLTQILNGQGAVHAPGAPGYC